MRRGWGRARQELLAYQLTCGHTCANLGRWPLVRVHEKGAMLVSSRMGREERERKREGERARERERK